MSVIAVEDSNNYRGTHQEPLTNESAIKARLYHWRESDTPDGVTQLEVQTCFEPGKEPYVLIGEEGCESFEPSSGAVRLTFPGLIEAMSDWSQTTCGHSKEYTAHGMADYLEMLAKTLRRSVKAERVEENGTRDSAHKEEA